MTGTGTQEDPYVVDTWNDFVTAVRYSNAYVTCPEGLIFDMNETAPDGCGTIIFLCACFDGNGLTIKNLYSTTNSGSSGLINLNNKATICNVNLENFYSLGTIFRYNPEYSNYGLTVYNCKFSGIMQNHFFVSRKGNSGDIWFNNCSFNLKINRNAGLAPDIASLWFNNCNINIDSAACTSEEKHGSCFNNCLITGSINYNFSCLNGSNSIIDADITHSWDGGTGMECCLVNSDRIAEGVTIGSSYTLVTSEQLRDADYLASIGFPIGVE